ncbi:TPA: hypothetical protein KRM58_003526 [Clostridioides difficile]|nr:hypothetical protein [Clostridioides difficile]HBH1802306.1 hypothetical protein [Clostridioides difficile]
MSRHIKIWTLDTETRGLFGEVFRVGLYDGFEYYVYNSFDDILEVIKSNKEYENHVYVHNLDFDLAKIAPQLFNSETINFDKSLFINGSVASLKTELMILHDSLKLLPSSLDKLSDDFGLTTTHKMNVNDYIVKMGWAVYNDDGSLNEKESKGNFFMNVEPDDEVLNEYLKLDCIALYDIINKVIDISELEIEKFIMCPTTASLAINVFKINYTDDYEKATKTKFVGEWGEFLEGFIRCGYYGGRTEVFKPWINEGFHYDVNSLYPYVMKNFSYPVGFPNYKTGDEALKFYRYWKKTQIGGGFIHCKIDVPENLYIPPLPYKDDTGKLLFPTGKLEGVWTLEEIKVAEKVGCTIEKVEQLVYFQKMESVFKNYIEYFEEVKNTSKGAKRNFAKLMLNTLYGKFGMIRVRNTYLNYSDIAVEELKEKQEQYVIHEHTNNLMNVKFIETLFRSKAQYIQPQISAYVTSYARILLYEALLKQQENGEVAYCDTDSIACTTKMDETLVDDKEFGKWKLESNIEKAIFLQPKFYSEKNSDGETIRAKGIPKEIMSSFSFETYEKWLEQFRDKSVSRIDIFKDLEGRKKFMSSLKQNENFDTKVMFTKSINLKLTQKRKMDYIENTTSPHTKYCYGDKHSDQEILTIDYFTTKLNEYNDDDTILNDILEIGYIKIPRKNSSIYKLYNKLGQNARCKYFKKQGIDIKEWCNLTGWNIEELFSEMSL